MTVQHDGRPTIRVDPVVWDSAEGELARKIRFVVFIEEQQVPPELELDDIDAVAFHVLAYDGAGEALATGRLFTDPEDEALGHIGRMATLTAGRGKGLGRAVLLALMREGVRRGYARLVLDSQVHAIPFYEKLGFAVCGPEHVDAGILHKLMEQSAEGARAVIARFQ